jgi:hypothetical protein
MTTPFLCERCFYPINCSSFITAKYARENRHLLVGLKNGMIKESDKPGYPVYYHPLCYLQQLGEGQPA